MSDRPPDQAPGPSRKFVPDLKPLENRFLLSSTDHSSFRAALAPKHGGIAVQSGTVLSVTVDRPTTNTVQVTDDGKGDVQAEWNGGAVNSFTGVNTVQVHAEKARNDRIRFSLTGPATVLPDVAIRSRGRTDLTPTPDESGHPLVHVSVPTPPKHGGVAVQTGTVLNVTVDSPRTNTVQITDVGAGDIQVAWNGGTVHSFTGVTTIVVNAKKAGNDQISFRDDSSHIV